MWYLNRPEVHPYNNTRTAAEYLKSLSTSDPSQRYFSGQEKYQSTLWNKFKIFLSPVQYLKELASFYPYQKTITSTLKKYEEDSEVASKKALTISAISVFVINQLGRRGVVLPFLSQYGRYLKSHRVFRHYVWALILPFALLNDSVNLQYVGKVETLWKTHSRRMSQKILDDPKGSVYPASKLSDDWRGIYIQHLVPGREREWVKKNQGSLFDSDYEGEEFETVDIGGDAGGEAEEDEE